MLGKRGFTCYSLCKANNLVGFLKYSVEKFVCEHLYTYIHIVYRSFRMFSTFHHRNIFNIPNKVSFILTYKEIHKLLMSYQLKAEQNLKLMYNHMRYTHLFKINL